MKNNTTNPAKPRAFLNYLVFDEEFNLNETASGAVQVGGSANAWEYLSMPADVIVPQNGFIAIYISNEEAMEVYFDNVTIIHSHSRLIEEQNYYPHGLLTTKSVAATGADPENKFQYQGKEMQDKIGLHLYDFHARQYDPQIGRFWGIDPADQFSLFGVACSCDAVRRRLRLRLFVNSIHEHRLSNL